MRSFHSACLLALATGALGACFNPDLSQLTLLCTAERPECPSGQTCINDRCVPLAADLGETDASTDASTDTDGGTTPDLSLSSGCADGSRNAVGVAYACAGAFTAGKARQLCAPGWRVCTKSAGIDQTACGTLPGFFIADVPAYFQGNQGNESCGTGGQNPLWYGCGSPRTGVRMGVQRCQGFIDLLDCRTTGLACSTGNFSIDTTANSTATDGILCCP